MTVFICPFCGAEFKCPDHACCGEVGHLQETEFLDIPVVEHRDWHSIAEEELSE